MTPADVIEGRARWCVLEGDSTDVLASLPPASVHALVTDPPAGIGFMGREWDKDRGGRAQWVAWLASVLGLARVAVRPGGRAFVWALPRTTHWTGCAVEDAGWAIETVVTHLFGTGWPKGASQLKPSSEHWYLARTGPSTPLNVDGCRVGTQQTVTKSTPGVQKFPGAYGSMVANRGDTLNPPGRWPPNTLLTHSPGCERVGERRVQTGGAAEWIAGRAGNTNAYGKATVRPAYGHADPDGTELVEAWRCVEGCPVAELDAQSGESTTPQTVTRGAGGQNGAYGAIGAQGDVPSYGDTGTASRFFPCFPADDDPAQFAYIAKPSRAEKNAGCEGIAQQRHVVATGRMLNPVCANTGARGQHCTCGACAFDSAAAPRAANAHPTVKPIALMRWLLRLITEPGDIVLDPFGGSGTTGVAALLEGRRVILVERDPAFAAICRARLSHAAPTAATLTARVAAPIAAPAPDFGPLFSR